MEQFRILKTPLKSGENINISTPFFVKPGFSQPVKRFLLFQSLCPCRTNVKLVIKLSFYFCIPRTSNAENKPGPLPIPHSADFKAPFTNIFLFSAK